MREQASIPVTVAPRQSWISVTTAVVLTLALLLVYYGSTPNFRRPEQPASYGGDYFQEWLGGRFVNSGTLAPHYDPVLAESFQRNDDVLGFVWDDERYFPIVYPPFYYVLVAPLSLLPYVVAARLWALAMVVCYVVSSLQFVPVVRPLLPPRWQHWAVMIVPGGLLYPPVVESLMMNQKGTLCLLLTTSAYFALRRNRPFLAGIFFGWMLFKPHLALPVILVMVWKRQWSFVMGSLCVLMSLGVLGLFAGFEAYLQFIQFVLRTPEYIHQSGYSLTRSHCVDSFFHGLIPAFPHAARAATVITSIALVIVTLRLMKGQVKSDSERFSLQFSGLILVTVLLSPHLYGYDLSLMLLVFVLVLRATWHGRHTALGRVAGYLVIALFCTVGLSEQFAAVTGVQFSVLLLLALLGVIQWLAEPTPEFVREPVGVG